MRRQASRLSSSSQKPAITDRSSVWPPTPPSLVSPARSALSPVVGAERSTPTSVQHPELTNAVPGRPGAAATAEAVLSPPRAVRTSLPAYGHPPPPLVAWGVARA